MVDSPCIGKVLDASFRGHQLSPDGHFWFDTYTGTNYHWLAPYKWFYIHTDEWLIYLLQYDEGTTPILIKNRKQNRWFYSGAVLNRLPQPFKAIQERIDYVNFTYSIDGELGQPFEAHFRSNDININIKSIPETIVSVFKYDYYKNDAAMNGVVDKSDLEYYDKIRNISFQEYFCMSKLTIEYEGQTTVTEARTLYEGKINK